MTLDEALDICRNPHGWTEYDVCEARLLLADEVERLQNEVGRRPKSYPAHSCDIPGCAVCDPTHGL